MNTIPDRTALRHVTQGLVLFHNGMWGAEMCYMWSGPEPGRGTGRLPQWESESLDRLYRRGLVTIEPGPGTTDVPLRPTAAGLALLGSTAV